LNSETQKKKQNLTSAGHGAVGKKLLRPIKEWAQPRKRVNGLRTQKKCDFKR